MKNWKQIREHGLDVITWWEIIVKPGLKRLALERSKELCKEQRGELNLLLIQQAYLVNKVKNCHSLDSFTSLLSVQRKIR